MLAQNDTAAASFLQVKGQTREQRTKPQKSSTEAKRRQEKPSSPTPFQASWSLGMNPPFLVENPELCRATQLPSGILTNLWAWKQISDLSALVESHWNKRSFLMVTVKTVMEGLSHSPQPTWQTCMNLCIQGSQKIGLNTSRGHVLKISKLPSHGQKGA